ncbi:MAG: hypothetical protein K8T10_12065 [Candidatus Eremiobacteraeota bacterium]|nr:hypothetical protein [Candidatus Eremiobacteraeota bacterium]
MTYGQEPETGCQKKEKKRLKKAIILVVTCVALPVFGVLLGLFMILFLLIAYNPMGLAFKASFNIVNKSGEDMRITPIGMWEGKEGYYGPLPRFYDKYPPMIPNLRNHSIKLKANQKLKYTYDWDDINFRHILIERKNREIYILDTDKMGTSGACIGPQKKSYEIPHPIMLETAPPELIPCTKGKEIKYSGAVQYRPRLFEDYNCNYPRPAGEKDEK